MEKNFLLSEMILQKDARDAPAEMTVWEDVHFTLKYAYAVTFVKETIMKIRRGFVTNSSSTNFGVMVITSIASVSAASFLSLWDHVFGVDKSKKKDYVRLCIEAPGDRTLKAGDSSYIKAKVLKASIIDGVFENTLESAGTANIELIKGKDIIESIDGEGSESVTFTITNDLNIIASNSRSIIFRISSEGMTKTVEFAVPASQAEPSLGVFFAGQATENILKIKANWDTSFYEFYKNCKFISGEIQEETRGDISVSTFLLKECMSEEQIQKQFGRSKAKIDNKFNIFTDSSMGELNTYTARIIYECIIVPPTVKEPIELKAYSEENPETQEKNGYLLAVKVMKYSEDKKDIICDVELTNNLDILFSPDKNITNLTFEKAEEIIANSKIIAELVPDTGEATDSKPYATYRIYPSKLITSDVDTIDMDITLTCDDIDIQDLTLKALLKPQINYKAMIKWFIEYPQGTFIDKYVKLGNTQTYWAAIDFIENRIFEISKVKNPRSVENHYEDGKLDVSRAPSVILLKESMPQQIGDFKEIQSLFHELTHTIEDQNGDISLFEGFKANPGAERHSYFIQFLSDAVKLLSDLERNFSGDYEKIIWQAIGSYSSVYFNHSNLEPIDYFAQFNWFGTETPTQHIIFGKYAMLNVLYEGTLLTSEQTEQIAKCVKKFYFPGKANGTYTIEDGFFKGAQINMKWSAGTLSRAEIEFPGYKFAEKSREWQGGNTLALRIIYDIESDAGKTDTLIAYLNAGNFDTFDYHYQEVPWFDLTWKPTLKISDCIIGSDIEKTVKLVKQ